jgi:hypothetical protein
MTAMRSGWTGELVVFKKNPSAPGVQLKVESGEQAIFAI